MEPKAFHMSGSAISLSLSHAAAPHWEILGLFFLLSHIPTQLSWLEGLAIASFSLSM